MTRPDRPRPLHVLLVLLMVFAVYAPSVGNGFTMDDEAMAMSVIDLLADGAARAKEVLAKSPPRMTKDQYVVMQSQRLSEELYEGK